MTDQPSHKISLVVGMAELAASMLSKAYFDDDGDRYAAGMVRRAIEGEIRHALSTSKPVAEAVKVKPQCAIKPLEWEAYNIDMHKAETFFGYYVVAASGHCWISAGPRELSFESIGKDVEMAKGFCQADYEQRIMSALSTLPQPAEAQGDNGGILDEAMDRLDHLVRGSRLNQTSGSQDERHAWQNTGDAIREIRIMLASLRPGTSNG